MQDMGSRKTALITGASGGIGYELAKLFAADGFDIVLVARSEDKLKAAVAELEAGHGITGHVIAADLTKPDAPEQIHDQLQQDHISIDALVNNAGFATYRPFIETDLNREMQMIQLNVACLTHLTRLFLPGMVERGQGWVMNVASTAAFQPGPLMAVYYASKAYVLSFSEAIAAEVAGSGVKVSALCPGPTESGFQQRAAMEDSKLVQGGLMDAAAVAQRGYQGLMRGQRVVVPGTKNALMAFSTRFVPRDIATKLVMNLQGRTDH